jgi:hypothetical protein
VKSPAIAEKKAQNVTRAPIIKQLRKKWDSILWNNITSEALQLEIVQHEELDREGQIQKAKVPRFVD